MLLREYLITTVSHYIGISSIVVQEINKLK